VGFNPDLPARDNVLLNATMLGLSTKEARARFDDVLAFAELEQFVDLKLKNYSSGMLVRLAFAVMIQVDADVLLIDEVLAVGDASFQQKCFDEFERIRGGGQTVLLVTHDMSAVRRFCTRALLIENGRPVLLGDPEDVGNRYLELNFSERARAEVDGSSRTTLAVTTDEPGHRINNGAAEIIDAWFLDEQMERTEVLKTAYPCTFMARVRFHRDVEAPQFSFGMSNSRRQLLFTASTDFADIETGSFAAGDEMEFRVYFGNLLAPDRYDVTVSMREQGGTWIDHRDRMHSVMVTATRDSGGLVQIPHDIGLHRFPAGKTQKLESAQ
jgi:energy-coupling factor transporter ATP-binding protein EcfA2